VLTEAVTAILTTPQLAVKVIARAKNNFEIKQSTIGDNSCNNQLEATKKAVATGHNKNNRQPEAVLPEAVMAMSATKQLTVTATATAKKYF